MLSFAQCNTGVLSLLVADQKSATLQGARVRVRRPTSRHCSGVYTAQARSAQAHTHRHCTPPLVGPSVYLHFKGMGRNAIDCRSQQYSEQSDKCPTNTKNCNVTVYKHQHHTYSIYMLFTASLANCTPVIQQTDVDQLNNKHLNTCRDTTANTHTHTHKVYS